MANFTRIVGTGDIISGLATVNTGGNTKPMTADREGSVHVASGTDPAQFTILDARFKLRPSGWSH